MVTEGLYTYYSEQLVMHLIVKSLGDTLKTNVILYVNSTSIKKNEIKM